MLDDDNVTGINAPTFGGSAFETGLHVDLFARNRVSGAVQKVGESEVGDDFQWAATAGTRGDGAYDCFVQLVDPAGNIESSPAVSIWVDTVAPNTPFLDLLNDTGPDIDDNVTSENVLSFLMIGNDTTGGGDNPFPNDVKFRLYWRHGNGSIDLSDSNAWTPLATNTSGSWSPQSLIIETGSTNPVDVEGCVDDTLIPAANFRLKVEQP
jgi:hypothetical protein